jgi:glycosyltransferase involved in cell wall biosynthesis
VYAIVTNDLLQDQRMQRICTSLSEAGYDVTLLGRTKPDSRPLEHAPYRQVRLRCLMHKGPLFYLEFAIRSFCWLLLRKKGLIWAADTDTLTAAMAIKRLRGMAVIWDAHEYFTEVPELEGRRLVKKIWQTIEKTLAPYADEITTVSPGLANVLKTNYRKEIAIIYNVPKKEETPANVQPPLHPVLLYQGMLNEGRGLEQMIEAMESLPETTLVLAGEGDLSASLRKQAAASEASDRIVFAGWQDARSLRQLTCSGTLGLNLLNGTSLSYRLSLANKFFDYMHAGLPSVNMAFGEYTAILSKYPVGIVVPDLEPAHIAATIQEILASRHRLDEMRKSCIQASDVYSWQNEEKKVLAIVQKWVDNP